MVTRRWFLGLLGLLPFVPKPKPTEASYGEWLRRAVEERYRHEVAHVLGNAFTSPDKSGTVL
jgi:hypothetical protein